MSLFRIVAERASAVWVSLMATAMVAGGLLVGGMGATLGLTALGLSEFATPLASSLMAVGAALAVAGSVAAIAHRRSVRPTGGRALVEPRPLIALIGVAATLPILLAVSLAPLFLYWRDVLRLADRHDVLTSLNGPSAMVFLPAAGVLLVPALEAVAAVTIAAHSFAVAALALGRSAAVRSLSCIGAILVTGLCAGSVIGTVATERLIPAIDAQIRTSPDAAEQAGLLDVVERHRSVCVRSARTLAWAWLAVVAIAVAVRAAVGVRAAEADVAHLNPPLPPGGADSREREAALLEAAERLSRTTPPRRF